jgi:hypothetical protein
MSCMTGPQTGAGLLVIRIWVEPAPDISIRARITGILDVNAGQTSVVARSPEEALAMVSSWLEAFMAAARASSLAEPDDAV